jgi:hypothetical protein
MPLERVMHFEIQRSALYLSLRGRSSHARTDNRCGDTIAVASNTLQCPIYNGLSTNKVHNTLLPPVLKWCHDVVAEGWSWGIFVESRAIFRQVMPACLAICGK